MRTLTTLVIALSLFACHKNKEEDLDGDGYLVEDDCDDGDANVHPDADERCNGVDDDCDGEVDEEPVDGTPFYLDRDADGYGDDYTVLVACETPESYVVEPGDCVDTDPAYHPGAPEDDCTDPSDYNCDGSVGYADEDGDGFAACEDCNDADPGIHPFATEVCDGVDNDCDGSVDGADALDAVTFWVDADGDGYGDPAVSEDGCEAPSGYVSNATDCDDTSASVHPGAEEHCDAVDEDCDGEVDEDAVDAPTWYLDADGDEEGTDRYTLASCEPPEGYVSLSGDCDDLDASSYSGGTEVCDGADNDCDGDVDEDATDAPTWYADADGDAWGDPDTSTTSCAAPSGYVADDSDCDDTDAMVHPGQYELCNGLDDDCDGSTDEEAVDASTYYADADGDGYGDASTSEEACEAPSGYVSDASDCDDGDDSVYPGADEYCDGTDHDCDGDTLEDDSVDAETWYLDLDGDGYGGTRVKTTACEAPSSYVADSDDCDDLDDDIHPGADEVCNGEDDDCDGLTDDDDTVISGTTAWYPDEDGDGYGDAEASPTEACEAPSGTVDDASDCDDTDSEVFPGGTETCDGEDEDCDGVVDEGFLGTGALCPADSCADVLADDATATDGEYWIDFAGTSTYTECDMSTDGGGWTLIVSWDRESEGDTLSDFETLGIENINTMDEQTSGSSYIQWSDYTSPAADALDYEYDVDVSNGGESLSEIHYYGYSMEGSSIFFWAEAGGSDEDIKCMDDNARDYYPGYWSTAEWAVRPSYTCGSSGGGNLSWSTTYQDDFGTEIEAFHITSLHSDGGHGDYSRLYRFAYWVR